MENGVEEKASFIANRRQYADKTMAGRHAIANLTEMSRPRMFVGFRP